MKTVISKSCSIFLAAMLSVSALTGCQKGTSGVTEVSIGAWPTESQPELLEQQNEYKQQFEEQNKDVRIIPNTYKFDTKTFMVKAGANQLPNLYNTYFTETKKNISHGFAADITDELKEIGWFDAISPEIREYVEDENGHVYGVPFEAYAQGLCINQSIFREAGLVNDDGSIMIPQTLDEVAEFAKTIKEKTGKAGFVISTTNNGGGWQFMNIAWDYGVEFMKDGEDGKYIATFDTQECADALQYVSDLCWKYNALPDNKVVDVNEGRRIFATGQAGMIFHNPSGNDLVQKYGMNKDDLFYASMPSGPRGRFAQMGGNLFMFSANSTKEQILAGLKWLDFKGSGPFVTEETLEKSRNTSKIAVEKGEIVMDRDTFPIWNDEESNKAKNEIRKEYCNVDMKNYEDYYEFKATLKPEVPVCAQQLYAILDKCIQEVLTNKNADCRALAKQANEEFQKNHLDKE